MASIRTSDCQTVELKTDLVATTSANVIWASNIELPQLTHDECLPVIGNSSILSNLDTEKALCNNLDVGQNMELVVLQNSDYKLPHMETTATNNYVILKTNLSKPLDDIICNEILTDSNPPDQLVYFTCELCPFLCLNEKRFTEHIQTGHQNKNAIKLNETKCPGCDNIFFNKLSLRSHLMHDHSVTIGDLTKIVSVLTKTKTIDKSEVKKTKNKESGRIQCRNESDLKYDIDKQPKLTTESNITNEEIQDQESLLSLTKALPGISSLIPKCQTMTVSPSSIVNLPTVDIIPIDSDKMFNSFGKKQSPISKLLEKNVQKCTYSFCKVHLQNVEKLNYHIRCHVEETFKCPECKEEFAIWKPLTGHLWRQHKIDMELYGCDKCDYKTYSLGKLNSIHKLIHNDAKPFLCSQCPRAFKNSKQLRNHKSLHKQKAENQNFVCPTCSKSFSDRRQIRLHTDSVHKKIKPFLCTALHCGYKGATRSALKMHMRQHTGEKPFSCDTCSYKTADHNSLRRHKLRHSGEMPYKCVHCDYACIQSSTYKVHLKTKHPGLEKDLLYSCTECMFRTINKTIFTTHMQISHNKAIEELN